MNEFKTAQHYPEINHLLQAFANAVEIILEENLIGLYLFGSLVYGDFLPNRSDIDLVAIVQQPLNHTELIKIKKLHEQFGEKYPEWKERLECSYTPVAMLSSILPPAEPRPYFGGGVFYAKAEYGNEWIINNYLLIKNSFAMIGPQFKTLLKPIDIADVQKACIRDLFTEWAPKVHDQQWLENPHYQSYLILNLCRIFYTVSCGDTGNKRVSATWVKNHYPEWLSLIETAEAWEYGKPMPFTQETIGFIQFVIDNIKI